jgi:hypothetical protein
MADHDAVSTHQIDIADCSESSKLHCINATRMDDNETGKQPSEIKPKKVSPNPKSQKKALCAADRNKNEFVDAQTDQGIKSSHNTALNSTGLIDCDVG